MVGRSEGDAGRICWIQPHEICAPGNCNRKMRWDEMAYAGDEDVWYNFIFENKKTPLQYCLGIRST